MVGKLGPPAIGAVGLGNAIYYAPSLFGIGLLLGLDTMVSRSWGAKDFDNCHRWLAQAMYIALAFTPLLMLFIVVAQPLFTARGVDPVVGVLHAVVRQHSELGHASAAGLRRVSALSAGSGAGASGDVCADLCEPGESCGQLDLHLREAGDAGAGCERIGAVHRVLANLYGGGAGVLRVAA